MSPSSGSVEGGTALTISGNYFYDQAETTVTVGGRSHLGDKQLLYCRSLTNTEISFILHV